MLLEKRGLWIFSCVWQESCIDYIGVFGVLCGSGDRVCVYAHMLKSVGCVYVCRQGCEGLRL